MAENGRFLPKHQAWPSRHAHTAKRTRTARGKTDPKAILHPLTGEFVDPSVERDFRRQDFFSARARARLLVALFSILLTAIMTAELFFVPFSTLHWIPLTLRGLYMAVSILVLVRISSLSDFEPMAVTVTAFEALSLSIWLYVALLSREAYGEATIQTGMMALLVLVFLIPNRWIRSVILGGIILLGAILLALSPTGAQDVLPILSTIVILMGGFATVTLFSQKTEQERRMQYLRHVKLLQDSLTDPLTGIANRGRFNQALQDWVRCANQYSVPLSLVLFDFDDFKSVNDTYGHLTGDQVILATVNLVDDAIRRRDLFARWGGEEFTLLFPDTRVDEAVEIVERLRQTIEQNRYIRCGQVTASFGIVQYRAGETPEAFMDRADRMLYRAKADGKNCIRSIG